MHSPQRKPPPRVVSSGTIEKMCGSGGSTPDAVISTLSSRKASYCSLADLPYTFSPAELSRLLEPCTRTAAAATPALGTVWEYRRTPRKPDSGTSNSLRSQSSDDEGEAMSEAADAADVSDPSGSVLPLARGMGAMMDAPVAPFVVYDGTVETDLSPKVRTPISVFDAGKWY